MQNTIDTDCWTCRSNSGAQRISPGATIYSGQHWLVEHAYPARRTGWIVIVLKRHAEALHELTADEFSELGMIQARLMKVLHEATNCQKEYLACYAELEHFKHVHIHVFAKPHDLPKELIGGKSFEILHVSAEDAAPKNEIADFCDLLRTMW
jgi:diadenosine tetraphosphate (Ap4A) HIT family hydrolase